MTEVLNSSAACSPSPSSRALIEREPVNPDIPASIHKSPIAYDADQQALFAAPKRSSPYLYCSIQYRRNSEPQGP